MSQHRQVRVLKCNQLILFGQVWATKGKLQDSSVRKICLISLEALSWGKAGSAFGASVEALFIECRFVESCKHVHLPPRHDCSALHMAVCMRVWYV